MNFNDEQVRAAIAEQASEWLVASDGGPLGRCFTSGAPDRLRRSARRERAKPCLGWWRPSKLNQAKLIGF